MLSYRWNYSIAHCCVDTLLRELPHEPLRLDQEDAGTTPDEDAYNEGAAAAAAEPAADATAPAKGAAAAAAPAGGEAPAVAAPAPSPAGKGAGQGSKKPRASG